MPAFFYRSCRITKAAAGFKSMARRRGVSDAITLLYNDWLKRLETRVRSLKKTLLCMAYTVDNCGCFATSAVDETNERSKDEVAVGDPVSFAEKGSPVLSLAERAADDCVNEKGYIPVCLLTSH